MSYTSFNAKSVETSNGSASLEHGEEYPALIAGLWDAQTEYQGTVRQGVYILTLIEDGAKKLIWRGFFVSLQGYVLGQNAAYSKLMRGLLRCSDTDGELKDKICKTELSDIRSLVGLPCLARICVKTKGDKSWASIETLQGETARFSGLKVPEVSQIEPVDIEKIAGKFIKISSVDDCETIKTLRVLGRSTNPRLDVDAETASVFRDNVKDALF